nr:MAG TPA: hypothetical protein [Caudoviricetes sp.]
MALSLEILQTQSIEIIHLVLILSAITITGI